jgi:AAHS family cis,cis-muconate transporter-like MFS transporter
MLSEQQEKISKTGWLAIIGVFIALIADGMDFMSLSLALPTIMKDFGVSHAKAGALGTYTMIGMAIGAIFAGWTSDRFGRVRTLLFCIAFFSIFTTLIGFVQEYWQMAVLRGLSGAGIAAGYAIGTLVVAEYMPTRIRAFAVGCVIGGYSIGFIVASVLGSLVLQSIGWRPMFYLALFPGALAFAVCLKVPEPPSWVSSNALMAAKKIARQNEFAIMWRDKAIRKTTLLWVFTGWMAASAYYGANMWVPTYITQELGVDLKSMSWFMAGSFIAAIIGKIIAGKVADMYGRKFTWVIGGIMTGLYIPFLIYFANQHNVAYLLMAFGMLYGTQFGIITTYIQESFPTHVRATAASFAYNIGRALAAVAPLALGFIAGRYSIGLGLLLLGVFFLLDAVLPAIFIKDNMYDPAAIAQPVVSEGKARS